MSDIFEKTTAKYRGSASSIVLFVLAGIMLTIGLNHFVEDTYSSYYGLKALESFYGLKVQIFDWSYATMSLAPQIASMVFFYMYLSDTTRKEFLIGSAASQAMDFFSDSWYRSGGQLFSGIELFGVSSLLTFVYFSIGSEVFLTIGGGLVIKLFAPAVASFRQAIKNVEAVKRGDAPRHTSYSPDGKTQNKPRYEAKHKPSHMQPIQTSFRDAMKDVGSVRGVGGVGGAGNETEPTYHTIATSKRYSGE